MDTAELRSRIKNYIEHADERLLRIFYAIIEVEKSNLPGTVPKDTTTHSGHLRESTESEKSQEEGMGCLKDDHRLK